MHFRFQFSAINSKKIGNKDIKTKAAWNGCWFWTISMMGLFVRPSLRPPEWGAVFFRCSLPRGEHDLKWTLFTRLFYIKHRQPVFECSGLVFSQGKQWRRVHGFPPGLHCAITHIRLKFEDDYIVRTSRWFFQWLTYHKVRIAWIMFMVGQILWNRE